MPHSLSVGCLFSIWSMLYQMFSFFFLLTAPGDLKQQSYQLIHTKLLLLIFIYYNLPRLHVTVVRFINRYQEKKARGEIKSRNIGSLPKQKQHGLREVWRNRKARNRKMKKDLDVILNETPPSPEQLDVSHDDANIIGHGSPAHDSPIPSPQAAILSTTPPPAQMLSSTNAPIAFVFTL